MGDVPVQLVIAGFQDGRGADATLDMLKQAKKERLLGIEHAAVSRKDEKGKLHDKETAAARIARPHVVEPGASVSGRVTRVTWCSMSADRSHAPNSP